MKTKWMATSKYHGRETRFVPRQTDKGYIISRATYMRLWRDICGCTGCKCNMDITDPDGNAYVADLYVAGGLTRSYYYLVANN
jgi:hypothetical protein